MALAPVDTKVSGGGTAENRVGYISQAAGSDSLFSTDFELTPHLVLSLSTPRSGFLSRYELHIFTQVVEDSAQQILLLHSLDLSYNLVMAPRWNLFASANMSIGTVDFSRSLFFFGNDSGSPTERPDAETISYLNVNATTGIANQISPRQRLSLFLAYGLNRPIAPSDNSTFPRQDQYSFGVDYSLVLTPRNLLLLSLQTGAVVYDPTPIYVPTSLTAQWQHSITPNRTISVQGGAMVGYQHYEDGEVPDTPGLIVDEDKVRAAPLGNIQYNSNFRLTDRINCNLNLIGGITVFFEQIRADVTLQAFTNASWAVVFPSKFATQVSISASTPVSDPPADAIDATGDIIYQPTMGVLNIGFLYPFAKYYIVSWGIQGNLSASHLQDSEFEIGSKEAVIYGSILANYDIFD